MYTVTVAFGLNRIQQTINPGTTVANLLANEVVRAALHFGDNVVAKIEGRVVEGSRQLCNGQTVNLETRANEKA
jgi:sulfur carrier protein ThiS